jgi:CRISPR system Cascade subunit CasD
MTFLLLRFVAPMQSWGSRSRFEHRDTEREPTFSGVVGLACAAMGLPRDADLIRFHELRMTVRVDREGSLMQEFQTAMDVYKADGSNGGTQIIKRHYLSDAEFHVALEGPAEFLKELFQAFHRPSFPLFLGRKSYVPVVPVVYPESGSWIETDASPLDYLAEEIPIRDARADISLYREQVPSREHARTVETRFVQTVGAPTGEVRVDIPMNFDIYDRTYAPRNVRTIVRRCVMPSKGGERWR